MPFRFEDRTTPRGALYLYVQSSGNISLADAHAYGAQVGPGSRHHNGLVLSVAEKGTEFEPAARKYFPTVSKDSKRLAVVTHGAIVRAAVNLMIRLTSPGNIRMCANEEEALQWLDGA